MNGVRRLLFAQVCALLSAPVVSAFQAPAPVSSESPIRFDLKHLPFRLQTNESPARNAPESMAGGIAVFDYNGDGRPDIFFANGSDLSIIRKSDPKYSDRLYRNNGDGSFSDVTEKAGLSGKGFDIGVATGDYDNDGHPDLFIAGVHGNLLYHNNGDETFSDVTGISGLGNSIDPEYGPIWSITAAWVDVNNDGMLDLFVVNYVQWHYEPVSRCMVEGRRSTATHAITKECQASSFSTKAKASSRMFRKNGVSVKTLVKAWGLASPTSIAMANPISL